MANEAPNCWILSDGKAGHENQSLGLAEALGRQPRVLRLSAKAPWRWLPPVLWRDPLTAVRFQDARPAPPWPELIIACGRTPAPVAAALRQASGGASFVVQIQDAKLPPEDFDLVVVPEHDRLRGAKVLTSRGALTRLPTGVLRWPLKRRVGAVVPQALQIGVAPRCAWNRRPLLRSHALGRHLLRFSACDERQHDESEN